ncbi:unnamed protein product [Dibothriocephalus latus]|uniref:G-protein coupled receptors family 1 profile domain-containing protein n=1 Tax=Dibothriocephalus latus TaxID=60516 RepID=A0A3P6S7E8_DIBLA|nr:unnamed protein product [Dibothriocephalus latus]
MDGLFLVSTIMSFFNLVLNVGVLVLLLLLRGKPKMFLYQLRAMLASVVLYSFIRTCDRVIPRRLYRPSPIWGAFLCHIWASRYLSLVAYTLAVLCLNFMVGNRAIQIACRYQYSFSTSVAANLAYPCGFCLLSIISMIPQTLIVQWDGKKCNCLDTDVSYGALVSLYTETFVRFGLTAVISVIILSISCYDIIHWVRNTPPEQLSDTWNIVYLPGSTKKQLQTFSRPQGWLTTSLCTVPLSVNFLVFSIYDTGYKFICAAGLCTIRLDSPLHRADRLLTDIQLFLLPIIITVYIPALRELPVRFWQKLVALGVKLRTGSCVTSERGQQNSDLP